MRVLVTGGSGFAGQRVVTRLVDAGHEVVALARSDASAGTLAGLGARPVSADLDVPESVDAGFQATRADVLVNVASLGFGHAPVIIAAAAEAGIGRALFVSTTAIFTTLPASSKRIRLDAERQVTTSGLEWAIVRPTMIYGAPGDRNMWRLLQALRRTPVIPLPGGGNGLQQPVHVDDLADAIVAAALLPSAIGNDYDVAGPEPLTLAQLVRTAAAAVQRSPRLVPVPLTAAIAGARLYERLAARPRLRAEQLERLAEDKVFDISAARRDLGYAPRSFAEGIGAEAAMRR